MIGTLTELHHFASLLLFLPGVALIAILDKRFQLKMSFLEKVVAGSITWNFTFASASVLIGLFPYALTGYFQAFGYFSALVLVIFCALKIHAFFMNRRRGHCPVKSKATFVDLRVDHCTVRRRAVLIDQGKRGSAVGSKPALALLYLSPVILVSSVVAMFTRISSSWDVWAIWLPMAKTITHRGDLLFHAYFLSKQAIATTPPYVGLAYAWCNTMTGGDYNRLVPIVYYLLFGVANYLLSKTLFDSRRTALGTAIISTSSLIVLATLFGFTLHPDLPLALFICTSMIYLVKIVRGETEIQNLLLFGFSLSLLMLTQVIGLFIAFVLLSFVVLCFSMPYRRVLFFVLFVLPFYVLVLLYPHSLQKLPLLLVYSVFLLAIVRKTNPRTSLKMTGVLTILLSLLPTLVYLFAVGQSSGIWAYTFATDASFVEAFTSLKSLISTHTPQSQVTVLSLFRYDDIFMRFGLVMYVPLIFCGILATLKEKRIETKILQTFIVMFLCVFLVYPQIFFPSLSPVDVAYIRRYMYILPLIGVVVSKGFFWLSDVWNSSRDRNMNPSVLVASFILYNAVSTLFTIETLRGQWPYPLDSIFAVSEMKVSLAWTRATLIELATLLGIVFISLLLITLVGMIHRSVNNRRNTKMLIPVSLILLVSASSFSLMYPLHRPLTDILTYGTETRYVLLGNMEELVNFFNAEEHDGVVLGYQKYYLVTFSDMKVIDLSIATGFKTFSKIFRSQDLDQTMAELKAYNVRYIIEPTNANTKEYKIFSEYRKEFYLFDSLLGSEELILIQSLSDYNVYEL